ncbi:MAG: DUF4012 domain-containing protein [Aeromicrobium sp.]
MRDVVSRARVRLLRRPGRTVAVVLALAVATAAVVFALQAYRASTSLERAASQAEQLQTQVVAGDISAARATLSDLRRSTARARNETDGPLWAVGAKVPWLGRNVSAVRTVAATLDDVTTQALPPIVNVSDQLNASAFSPQGGKIDLATIQQIGPAVGAADRSLTAARSRLSAIDPSELVGRLRTPVERLREKVKTAQTSAASAHVAAQLMPQMLGAGGERRYLLLIQNNAEIRATGGIAGAFAVIRANRGRVAVERTGSIRDLPPFAAPVLPMTGDEKTVFLDQLVRDLRDVNVTPDFPRSAQIARAMAEKQLAIGVDGVMSIDPVALSHVLAGTGAVKVGDGLTIDSTNAVEVLLNSVYRKYPDGEQQDAVFAASARKIFETVTSGSADPRKVIEGLSRSVSEKRLMLWSKRSDEQQKIAATGIAGAFARDDGASPHVGVYLGDAAGSKMQYYLDYSTVMTATRCLEGGRQEITTTTELTSDAPEGLPEYITGNGKLAPKGDMRMFAWLYAPHGGRFTSIKLDGTPQIITTARLHGRPETTVEVRLARGQTRTLSTTVISGPDQEADGIFSTTPGIRTSGGDVTVPSACR